MNQLSNPIVRTIARAQLAVGAGKIKIPDHSGVQISADGRTAFVEAVVEIELLVPADTEADK